MFRGRTIIDRRGPPNKGGTSEHRGGPLVENIPFIPLIGWFSAPRINSYPLLNGMSCGGCIWWVHRWVGGCLSCSGTWESSDDTDEIETDIIMTWSS